MKPVKSVSAIYPGSFDPITKGHVDLVERLSCFFDPLVLLVSTSASKNYLFSLQERVKLARVCLSGIKRVKVVSYNGMTVEYAKKSGIRIIIRGVRAVSDFEYELQMGYANSSINDKLETLYLMPTLENAFVSSTIVREIIRFDGKFQHLVPKEVLECM